MAANGIASTIAERRENSHCEPGGSAPVRSIRAASANAAALSAALGYTGVLAFARKRAGVNA